MKYMFYSLLFLCGGAIRLFAAAQSCESSPAIQSADRKLGEQTQSSTYEQISGLEDTAYRQMMALDPRDFRPFRDYLSHVR